MRRIASPPQDSASQYGSSTSSVSSRAQHTVNRAKIRIKQAALAQECALEEKEALMRKLHMEEEQEMKKLQLEIERWNEQLQFDMEQQAKQMMDEKENLWLDY